MFSHRKRGELEEGLDAGGLGGVECGDGFEEIGGDFLGVVSVMFERLFVLSFRAVFVISAERARRGEGLCSSQTMFFSLPYFFIKGNNLFRADEPDILYEITWGGG